jgi:hypothetical protein
MIKILLRLLLLLTCLVKANLLEQQISAAEVMFAKLADFLDNPTTQTLCRTSLIPTCLHTVKATSIQDPIREFWSYIFQFIASIIYSNADNLTMAQRQVLVELLVKSRAEQTGFFIGFTLTFLRRTAFPALRNSLDQNQLELIILALQEFLSSHGVEDPVIPEQLKHPQLVAVALDSKQPQAFATAIFDEFLLIHHYCLAWQALCHTPDCPSQSPCGPIGYVEQLTHELQALELEVEKEKKLFAQDKIKAERAREQKLKRLEELSLQEKELAVEELKNKSAHQSQLAKIDVLRREQEAATVHAHNQLELTHKAKLQQLEQKKVELILQKEQVGVFEKTIQKFSECLTAIAAIKKF